MYVVRQRASYPSINSWSADCLGRKIVLTGSYDDGWVSLTVTTTGKELHYFYDLDTSLYFSRIIIEKHGGQLSIEKEEEAELVISLSLPIDQNKPH